MFPTSERLSPKTTRLVNGPATAYWTAMSPKIRTTVMAKIRRRRMQSIHASISRFLRERTKAFGSCGNLSLILNRVIIFDDADGVGTYTSRLLTAASTRVHGSGTATKV